jgi:HTH-type transcriptional regulator/antitoxin HigA
MVSRLIKTEADYDAALAKIENLMGSAPGSAKFDELELLSALVELYEQRQYPIPPPDPIDAIKFRMEQAELKPKDLVPLIGSRAKVSEVLSGKRPLTLSIIRELHEKLGIPAEILLRKRETSLPEKVVPHPEKLPWKEIVERNWLAPVFRGTVDEAQEKVEELASYLLRNLRKDDLEAALFRRNVRAAHIDRYALLAWTARIMNVAHDTLRPVQYRKGSINDDFIGKLVSFSFMDKGPLLAKEFLIKNGVVLVIEPHLPKTHVDGAATMLEDGTPVIGMSLRYDRLDNFWFSLCHELAHVKLHLEQDNQTWYVDDLDVKDNSRHEKDADRWARDVLIPSDAWNRVVHCESPDDVENAAQELRISPAIIAGRIRYERKNYKLFSRLVGQGEVQKLFLAT